MLCVIFTLKCVISGLIKGAEQAKGESAKSVECYSAQWFPKICCGRRPALVSIFDSQPWNYFLAFHNSHQNRSVFQYFHFPCCSFFCIFKCLDFWKHTLLRLRVVINYLEMSSCCWCVLSMLSFIFVYQPQQEKNLSCEVSAYNL